MVKRFCKFILFMLVIHLTNGFSENTWKIANKLYERNKEVYFVMPGVKDPLEVQVHIHVSEIQSYNATDMTMEARMTIKQKWYEKRMSFEDFSEQDESIKIPVSLTKSRWTPDIKLEGTIASYNQQFATIEEQTIIYRHGDLVLSKRLTAKFDCPMNLRYFPFDENECVIRLSSFISNSSFIKYVWEDPYRIRDLGDNPVEVPRRQYPQFRVLKVTPKKGSVEYDGETYSYVSAGIRIKRNGWMRGTYIVEGIIVVTVSWLVFALTEASMACRFLYLLSCCSIQSMFVYRSTDIRPVVPYFTALDYWNCICFATVLLEITVLLRISNLGKTSVVEDAKKSNSTFVQKLTSFLCINNVTALIFFPVAYYLAVGLFFAMAF